MDNTVGSLTKQQKSVIVGTLLGDGYLRKMKGRKDAFLEINHAFSQKKYVDWKYGMLKNLTVTGPKQRKGNGRRVAYRFYTKQHPELSKLMNRFYVKGMKVIPEDIELDPLILAVWFMDDGSKCGSDIYLNTQQFSVDDQKRLLSLLDKINLKAGLNKDKSYYRIRFFSESIESLKECISSYIIASMRYKLFGDDPVETTRRSPAIAG